MTIKPEGKLRDWLVEHRPEHADGFILTEDQERRLAKFEQESATSVRHLCEEDRKAWALYCAVTHPGHGGGRRPPAEPPPIQPAMDVSEALPVPPPPPVVIQPDMAPVQAIVEQTLASASNTAATMEELGKVISEKVGATESKVTDEFRHVKEAFSGLTAHLSHVAEAIKSQPAPQVFIPAPPEPKTDYLVWIWRAIVLILLAILASRDVRGQVPHDPILVRVSNAGTPLTTRQAGLIDFNCSTNMTCSFSGNRFTMTASSTAGAAWSSITMPTTDLVLDMGAYTTTFTTGTGTSTSNIWTWKDTTGNTGTGYLATFQTVGTSAMKPIRITAKGTSNGVAMDATGALAPIGTGSIVPSAHSTSHKNGGSDEVATATAGANAIPKAGAGGTLASGWLAEVLALSDLSDVASKAGNSTKVQMAGAGTPSTDDCAKFDANGNIVTAGAACGSGGGSISGLTTGTIPKAASSTTLNDSSLLQDESTGQITSSKSINDTLTTVSFSSTPTFDASLGSKFTITLTNNVTSSTLSNAKTGQNLTFVICQDGTGGRTFVWPTGFSNAPTISGTASVCTSQAFVWSGSVALLSAPATSTDTPTLFGGATRSAPATPAASSLVCWFDSTANTQLCKDPSGNVYAVVKTESGATSSQWLTYINANGVPQRSQPAFSDLSGSATDAQVPDTITASNYLPLAGGTLTGALVLLSSASPTTGAAATVAFDNNAWAASHGAIQVHDGTAVQYVVAVDASDTPTNGQVPKWNTGGTITWENDTGGGGGTGCNPAGSNDQIVTDDGAGACASEGQWKIISNVLTAGASGKADLSAASGTDGLKVPTAAGAAPTADGALSVDSTAHALKFGSNGSTKIVATTADTIAWANIATRTKAIPIFGWTAMPDSTGYAWFEPAAVTFGSNDFHNPMVAVFGGETANVDNGIHFTFRIPDDFVSGAELCVTWASPTNSGDVYWKWNYNSVSSGSLDLASGSVEQSVHAAATANGTVRGRTRSCQSITDGNLSPGDTFQGQLIREASVTGTDTLADKAYAFLAEFGYTGR